MSEWAVLHPAVTERHVVIPYNGCACACMYCILSQCLRLADARMSTLAPPPSPATLHTTIPLLQGVQWMIALHQAGLSGILADEMGLGKTVQVGDMGEIIRASDHSSSEC